VSSSRQTNQQQPSQQQQKENFVPAQLVYKYLSLSLFLSIIHTHSTAHSNNLRVLWKNLILIVLMHIDLLVVVLYKMAMV
jgi:FtsH-binding integral membrane protein